MLFLHTPTLPAPALLLLHTLPLRLPQLTLRNQVSGVGTPTRA